MIKTTFKIPTADGPRDAEGYRVRLEVGSKPMLFMLQQDGSQPAILAHWASGYKVANLRAMALSKFLATGQVRNETPRYWRKLAQSKLDLIVREKGQDAVLAVIAAAPVLNGGPVA